MKILIGIAIGFAAFYTMPSWSPEVEQAFVRACSYNEPKWELKQ